MGEISTRSRFMSSALRMASRVGHDAYLFTVRPITRTFGALICSLILSFGTTSLVRAFPRLIRIIRTSFLPETKKAEESSACFMVICYQYIFL